MRFTDALASIHSQNVVLRIALLALVVTLILMGFLCAKFGLKPPLIIERACYSSVLSTASSNHSPVEVDAFIRQIIRDRFDSDAVPHTEWLSLDEGRLRIKEQDELSKRQMRQRVLVITLNKKGDFINIDADRIISVGNIRSAFSFPLQLRLAETSRSEVNPYGLVATQIIPATSGGDDDKK